MQNLQRRQFENPDEGLADATREGDPTDLVERAARTGAWVLVSTVRFPQFWKRVCDRLEELEEAGQISDSFRLLFDLQGYS